MRPHFAALTLSYALLQSSAVATPLLPDPLSRDEMGLRGKVKTVETRAEVLGVAGNSNNRVDILTFTPQGFTTLAETRERDLLTEYRHYERDAASNALVVRVEENITIDRRVIDLEERERLVVQLDKAGRAVHVERIDWMGEDSGHWEREFDGAGRVRVERQRDATGAVRSLKLSNFDSPTSATESFFDAAVGEAIDLDQAQEEREIIYDATLRPLSAVIHRPGQSIPTEVEYGYDAAGRKVREVHRRSGQVVEEWTWTYNEQGDLEQLHWDALKNTSLHETWRYQYDPHGNWTFRRHEAQTIALGETLPRRVEVTRRVLTYYP